MLVLYTLLQMRMHEELEFEQGLILCPGSKEEAFYEEHDMTL